MIYFLNINGTTTLVKSEPVYQNSINANKLIVFAPFTASSQISATFTLPNGLDIQGGLMTRLVGYQELYDQAKNKYNGWSLDLDTPITQYPGTVRVQFDISVGQGVSVASYSTQFIVEKGVPSDLPEYSVDTNALDVFNDIKDYLSVINQDMNEAIENGIAYVRYVSPNNILNASSLYVLNGTGITPSTNERVENLIDGDFTVDGATKFLTDAQIKNPGNNDYFFKYNPTGEEEPYIPAGFIIDLGGSKDVGLLQLYIYNIGAEEQNSFDVQVSVNNGNLLGTFTPIDTFSLYAMHYNGIRVYGEMLIIRVPVNQQTRFIKVAQINGTTPNAFTCKGIEIFKPNLSGYYSIVQNNGNYYNIPALDENSANDIINQVEGYSTEAQKWADGEGTTQTDPQYNNSSKYWAEVFSRYSKNHDSIGGFPVLVPDENNQPVIPSRFINKVDVREYIEITSESELDTINAQVGDVAVLVGTVGGEKTVEKSWILLAINNDVRDWAVFGTSYAANAGNAVRATNADNADKINGIPIYKVSSAEYGALTDAEKQGIYFVTMG